MDDYSSSYGAIFAIYLAVLIFYIVAAIASYVLTALSLSSLFRKVGVEPWAAWVPIYQYWKLLEVGGYQGWFSLLLLVPGANYVALVFIYIGMYRTGIAFRKDGAFLVLGIFLPFVWAFILGGKTTVYEPQLITAAGYPPPIAGYGSVPFDQRSQYGYGAQQQPQQPYGQQAPQQPHGQQAPQQPYGQEAPPAPQPPYPGA